MFDHHEYEVLEAEAFLKGQARGLACGMEKGLAQGMEKGIEKGMEKGAQQEREKNDAEKLKMAEFFRSKGISEEIIAEGFALK